MDELIPVGQTARTRWSRTRKPSRTGVRCALTDRARTVFLGSGAFAVPIVEALADASRGRAGRGRHRAAHAAGRAGEPTDPPVGAWAAEHGLPTLPPRAPARPRDSSTRSARARPGAAGAGRLRADRARRAARPAAPRRAEPAPVAAAAASRSDAHPGRDPGRRCRDRRHPDAHGRRPRHGPDRRAAPR